jgi:hypothetical protein
MYKILTRRTEGAKALERLGEPARRSLMAQSNFNPFGV